MILALVLDATSRLVVAVIVFGIATWSWIYGRTDFNPSVSFLYTFVLSFLLEDVLFKAEYLLNTARTQTQFEMDPDGT